MAEGTAEKGGPVALELIGWGADSGGPRRDGLDLFRIDVIHHEAKLDRGAPGGPALDPAELRQHLLLYAAMMGLCWLLDAPPRIRREVPALADATGPLDPLILASETARVQLQMMTNFLMLWVREDATGVLARLFG